MIGVIKNDLEPSCSKLELVVSNLEVDMEGVIILIVLLAIYFAPTLLAQGKDSFGPVLVINLFLGWTALGWIVALAMAAGPSRRSA